MMAPSSSGPGGIMFGSKKTDEEKAESKALLELRLAVPGGMLVRKEPLRFTAPGQMDVPVLGAKVTIDRGEAAKRITATRVALTGPFALALKKNTTRLFVTIEGLDGSALLLDLPVDKEAKARKLALLVHSKHPAPPGDDDPGE